MDDVERLFFSAKKVFSDAIEGLAMTRDNLDGSFLEAVDLLSRSSTILFCGVGKSGFVAKKLAATFTSVGFPSVFLSPTDALHGDIGVARGGETIVLLSKSGSTEELLRLAPVLRSRSLNVIGILGRKVSPLAVQCDVVLEAHIAEEGCPLNTAPMASTSVAMALGDSLAAALMTQKGISQQFFAANHPLGQLGKLTSVAVADIMHTGAALPLNSPDDPMEAVVPHITLKGLGCSCICDADGTLLGIITDGDIRRAALRYPDFANTKAAAVMTPSPIAIVAETTCGEALSLMEHRQRQIGVLPIVNSTKQCVGVVRIHDIIKVGL